MATLTVTIKEEVILNGEPRGSENVKSITATEYYHRIVEVPTASEATLLSFGSADAGSTINDGDAKYVRLTNLDSTNFVEARVRANPTFDNINDIKVKADTAACSVEVFAAS